ncbi:Nn.00g064590.m01.CDS01 [Neocucurbitaria sp. VM-36]
MFSMADMRLFHHFLITAYPHLPVGADKIWITVIPSFAHNYEYLIHSILALAASHLDAVSNSSVAEQAIQHRILAVKSLNEALSVPPKTRCERDARMAAALALAFQSSHLQDGMAEYLTMVRGCNLIAGDEAALNSDSAFHAFREDGHLQTMRSRIGTSQLNCVNREDLDLAAMSLREIEMLNLTDWERGYWDILVRTVDNAYERPVETYTTFVLLYNVPSRWTHDEFQAFIDPNNSVAQILLAHFIAIQAILTPILYLERVGFQGVDAPTAVLSWIDGIYRNVPPHLRHHVEWPRQVSRYPFMRFLGQKQMDYFDEDLLLAV